MQLLRTPDAQSSLEPTCQAATQFHNQTARHGMSGTLAGPLHTSTDDTCHRHALSRTAVAGSFPVELTYTPMTVSQAVPSV